MSAAVAVAVSAGAAAHAAEANRIACTGVVNSYSPAAATVDQMRHYAECVQYLHPAPLDPGGIAWMKVFIVITLLGMVIAWWQNRNNYYDSWWERYLMWPLIGACMGMLVAVALALLLACVLFLFTA